MTEDIVIIGAGNLAQEVLWAIDCINQYIDSWNVIGFMSELQSDWDRKEFKGYPILKSEQVKVKNAVIGIADPRVKYSIANKYKDFTYPNIIHPEVRFTAGKQIDGHGIVIFAGTTLMPYSRIKSFVYMNVHVVIGHDSIVNDYVSISPGALLMGHNIIGRGTYISVGVGSREKITIGAGCVIGANAAVISDIPNNSMAIGVPAKVVKTLEPFGE